MPGEKVKVLYIAGWDRSGSTILDRILGQLPGFFSVGELVHLWEGGNSQVLCECGQSLQDCAIWREIFTRGFGVSPDQFDFKAIEDLRRGCARSRHLILLPNPLLRTFVNTSFIPYMTVNKTVYRSVGQVSGARVVIDSSKEPAHGYLLQRSGVADLFVVHLIRDPRGCCYSYSLNKAHPDPTVKHFPTRHPAASALPWLFTNVATEMLWGRLQARYLIVHYEDFIARPKETVMRIADFVGEPVSTTHLPFPSEHEVFLRPGHGLLGNSVRFNNGLVQLKLDDRWRSVMKRSHKWAVTALTAAVLPKYGYWQSAARNA